MKKEKKIKKVISALVVLLIIVLVLIMCLAAIKLGKAENLEDFKNKIRNLGALGFVLMLFLQILQVVVSVVPGEPLELCAGALYGTAFGTLFCLFGIFIGSILVFLLVGKFGKRFVLSFVEEKKFSRLKFLSDPKKRDILIFLLMFIPGTPKDTITYFAPFSGISLVRFLVISTVARIPSVISSAYVGANVMEGKYLHSIIAFAVVGAVSIIGLLIYNKVLENKNKKKRESNNISGK